MERLGVFFVKKTKCGLEQALEAPQIKDPKVMVYGYFINTSSSWQLGSSGISSSKCGTSGDVYQHCKESTEEYLACWSLLNPQ